MSEKASPLTLALERLTVFDVWKLLGLEGTAKPFCRSPFRGDRNPSFSIYDGGHRWKDHASGESGDAADFCAKARSLSKEDGARLLIELAGTGRKDKDKDKVSSNNNTHPPRQEYDPFKDQQKARQRESWPTFKRPTQTEIRIIAGLRGLSLEGVSLADEHGLLLCAEFLEGRAWIITDSRRVNAQARRLDGKPWSRIGNKKAWTLSGSVGNWPIGLREGRRFPAIALTEGGPDLLAACHFIAAYGLEDDIAPVTIFGAGHHIPKDALHYFTGKEVTIYVQSDSAGEHAFHRWEAQLKQFASQVNGYGFEGFETASGQPVGDLNDFVHLSNDHYERYRDIVDDAFRTKETKSPRA